jgi:hypothetical protein
MPVSIVTEPPRAPGFMPDPASFLHVLYYLGMPENERKRHLPEWAERERLSDMVWVTENFFVFWPIAQVGYEQSGRGAITVDVTVQPVPGKGHPIWYLPQELVGEHFGPDEIRMVAQYEPEWQFVAILLKHDDKVSSYQVGVPDQQPRDDSSV